MKDFKLNIWKKTILSEINITDLKHSSFGYKEGEDSISYDNDRNAYVLFVLKNNLNWQELNNINSLNLIKKIIIMLLMIEIVDFEKRLSENINKENFNTNYDIVSNDIDSINNI